MTRRVGVLGVAAGFLVVVLWFALLWSPQRAKAADARKKADAAEARMSDLQLRLRRVLTLEANSAGAQVRLAELDRAIPERADLGQFVLDANEAAHAAGVDVTTLTPSAPAPGAAGGPAVVRVTTTFNGKFASVLDYIHRLEHLPRLFVIDTINLSPSPIEGVAGALTVSLQGRMFVAGNAVVTKPAARPGVPTVPGVSSTRPTAPRITLSNGRTP